MIRVSAGIIYQVLVQSPASVIKKMYFVYIFIYKKQNFTPTEKYIYSHIGLRSTNMSCDTLEGHERKAGVVWFGGASGASFYERIRCAR